MVLYITILLSSLVGSGFRDSMITPIMNGQVVADRFRSSAESHRTGIEILFGADPTIYSCSKGRVYKILQMVDDDQTKLILIVDADLTFAYASIDSLLVQINDSISIGQAIAINKISSSERSIFFAVYRGDRKENPESYLRFRSRKHKQNLNKR